MSKPDYTEFDAELLRLIAAGKNRMMMLENQKRLIEMARPFCVGRNRSPYGATPEWRIIDRRLQALRKKGKVAFNGKEWEVKGGA